MFAASTIDFSISSRLRLFLTPRSMLFPVIQSLTVSSQGSEDRSIMDLISGSKSRAIRFCSMRSSLKGSFCPETFATRSLIWCAISGGDRTKFSFPRYTNTWRKRAFRVLSSLICNLVNRTAWRYKHGMQSWWVFNLCCPRLKSDRIWQSLSPSRICGPHEWPLPPDFVSSSCPCSPRICGVKAFRRNSLFSILPFLIVKITK